MDIDEVHRNLFLNLHPKSNAKSKPYIYTKTLAQLPLAEHLPYIYHIRSSYTDYLLPNQKKKETSHHHNQILNYITTLHWQLNPDY